MGKGEATRFAYPESPSVLASKYSRYGYVDMRPFEPGQRYRARKDMEYMVSGTKTDYYTDLVFIR